MRRLVLGAVSCILLAILSVTGCWRGGPKLVPVSGFVRLDEAPLVDATVFFLSDTWQATGRTDSQGRYALEAVPGEYKVYITKPARDVAGGGGSPDPYAAPGEEEPVENLIPRKYSDPSQSKLTISVPAGGTDQAHFIDLTSDPPDEQPAAGEASEAEPPAESDSSSRDAESQDAQDAESQDAQEAQERPPPSVETS